VRELFVTGTDTEIGKTVTLDGTLVSGLVAALGLPVVVVARLLS
jgi:hypothetical protein